MTEPPADIAITVARIDERTIALVETVNKMKADLDAKTENYVTRAEFAPVKTLAYGLVGAVLLTVLGAVLYLVVRSDDDKTARKPDAVTYDWSGP